MCDSNRSTRYAVIWSMRSLAVVLHHPISGNCRREWLSRARKTAMDTGRSSALRRSERDRVLDGHA